MAFPTDLVKPSVPLPFASLTREEVRRLLAVQVADCEVRAFGSRVTRSAKPYSDLDIVLLGLARLSLGRLAALREAFAESELPIRVDVIDLHAISENFRDIIAAQVEILQNPALPDSESAKLERSSGSVNKVG